MFLSKYLGPLFCLLCVSTGLYAMNDVVDSKNNAAEHEAKSAKQHVYKHGRTRMHHAAGHGKTGDLLKLIQDHEPVNAQDNFGYAALHYAVKENQKEAIKTLIENKAQVDLRTKKAEIPLHFVQSEEVAKILVEAKADPQSMAKAKRNPLHYLGRTTPRDKNHRAHLSNAFVYLQSITCKQPVPHMPFDESTKDENGLTAREYARKHWSFPLPSDSMNATPAQLASWPDQLALCLSLGIKYETDK